MGAEHTERDFEHRLNVEYLQRAISQWMVCSSGLWSEKEVTHKIGSFYQSLRHLELQELELMTTSDQQG